MQETLQSSSSGIGLARRTMDRTSSSGSTSSSTTSSSSDHRSRKEDDDAATAAACVFYSVFIPADAYEEPNFDQPQNYCNSGSSYGGGEAQQVFTDKQEALKVVKKYRGARFKAFKNHGDAIRFSRFPAEPHAVASSSVSSPTAFIPSVSGDAKSTPIPDSNNTLERGTTFRGPKAQELVKLRKAIESGDADFFHQTVWSNPRYLISSGDTPTILQEGPRYNALHVVAKSKQSAMCQYVLETIEDVRFMQLLYNDDSPATRRRRINFLVDLYINMPDKALCETPLHFASKFGCPRIVEVLASHPSCVKNIQNKYNQTPKDVICTRCSSLSSCSELKRQIEEALEDHYFVPVLGAVDNSRQPYLGEPWSPYVRLSPSDGRHKQLQPARPKSPAIENDSTTEPKLMHDDGGGGGDLLESVPFVRAYAGPMSPKSAQEFRHRWKTPPFARVPTFGSPNSTPWSGRARLLGIRLSDTDKGLERIGRELARESNIPWVEHWSFLGTYCDLAKPDGLNKLETYLRNKYNEMMSEQSKWEIGSQDISVFERSRSCYREESTHDSSVFDDDDDDRVLSTTSRSNDGSLESLCYRFSMMNVKSPGSDHKYPSPCPGNVAARGSSSTSRKPLKINYDDRQAARANTRADKDVQDDDDDDDEEEQIRESINAKLASGQRAQIIVDHLCRDIANRMTREVCELELANQLCISRPHLRRAFVDNMKPNVECLMRFTRHLMQFCSSNNDGHLDNPHVTVARHVLRQLNDELSEDKISATVRSMASKEGFLINFLSSDDEETSEEMDNNIYRYAGAAAAAYSMAPAERVSQSVVRQHLKCIFERVVAMIVNHDHDGDGQDFKSVHCGCDWNATTSTTAKMISNITGERRDSNEELLLDGSTPSDTNYRTPPSSIVSSQRSSLSEAKTPEEGLLVFINGSEPTKLDVDVLRALEGCPIDPILYPHIYRWKFQVTSYSTEEIENWPTPMSLSRNRSARETGTMISTPNSTSSVAHRHSLRLTSTPERRPSIQANLYESVFQKLAKE